MFKPEYIIETFKLFGWNDTMELIYKRLRRMGKSPRIAQMMAMELMEITIG